MENFVMNMSNLYKITCLVLEVVNLRFLKVIYTKSCVFLKHIKCFQLHFLSHKSLSVI